MTKEIVEGGFFSNRPELRTQIERIKFPPRTGKSPSGRTDRVWVNGITSSWTQFRDAAIDWLAMRGPTEIDLLRFDDKSLNEVFTLPTPSIRKDILKMRRKVDVRDVHRYFSFGREIAKNEAGEPVVSITRRELLQLYIVVYARRYLLWQRRKQLAFELSRNQSVSSTVSPNKYEGVNKEDFFNYIDKIMRRKPEHGGPLFAR